jgi:integrase
MLTDKEIRAYKPKETGAPYRVKDSENLYLIVYPTGIVSWEYRYKVGDKTVPIILGRYGSKRGETSAAAARDERDRLNRIRKAGRDPRDEKALERERQQRELADEKAKAEQRRADVIARKSEKRRKALTLKTVAEEWIRTSTPAWTAAHAWQVEQQLRDHVYPTLGDLPIESIKPADVLALLGGMLAGQKVELARRARQRLDAIFSYAGIKYELSANPVAVAKGELRKRFDAARRARPAENFPTINPKEAPALLAAMRAYRGSVVTQSLLWVVALTACRTGEARFATWDEFTLTGNDPHWFIPANRMKSGREHRIPLAPATVAILQDLRAEIGEGGFVFPHPRRDDKPASENAILYVLAEIGFKDRMTGHGFRSLFSTIANESGLHRPDVIEAVLAHGDNNGIRATYNRATYAQERRALANWYADELARLEATATPAVHRVAA